MRVLGSIVLSQSLFMPCRQPKFTERRGIGSQLVRDDNARCHALLLQELAHQLQRGSLVSFGLDQKVRNLTFAIHGTPQIHLLATDRNEHFVEVPPVTRPWPAPSKPLGVEVSELQDPPPYRLVGDFDPPFRQQFLDVPIAKCESQLEPGCLLDDQGRKAMTAIGERLHPLTIFSSQLFVSC